MAFLRLEQVMKLTGLARATIYKYQKNGCFPHSVSLGDNAVAWVEEEIHEWMEEKIRQRDESMR